MSDKIDQIDTKVDKLGEDVTELKVTVAEGFAKYHTLLEVHIAGTKENHDELVALRKDFVPVQDHVKFIRSLAKLVLGIGSVASAIIAGLKFFGKV